MGLRHWGPQHDHTHINKTHSLRTSLAPTKWGVGWGIPAGLGSMARIRATVLRHLASLTDFVSGQLSGPSLWEEYVKLDYTSKTGF